MREKYVTVCLSRLSHCFSGSLWHLIHEGVSPSAGLPQYLSCTFSQNNFCTATFHLNHVTVCVQNRFQWYRVPVLQLSIVHVILCIHTF